MLRYWRTFWVYCNGVRLIKKCGSVLLLIRTTKEICYWTTKITFLTTWYRWIKNIDFNGSHVLHQSSVIYRSIILLCFYHILLTRYVHYACIIILIKIDILQWWVIAGQYRESGMIGLFYNYHHWKYDPPLSDGNHIHTLVFLSNLNILLCAMKLSFETGKD